MIFVCTLLTVAILSFAAGALATGKIRFKLVTNKTGTFLMIGVMK
jgi:hypothetical protein